MHRRQIILLALASVAAALFLAGCGVTRSDGNGSPSPTPPASATPSATASTTPSTAPSASPAATQAIVSVYLMRGQHVGTAHRTIERTDAPANVALAELLAGPTAEERAAGLHTQIPAGTSLIGVNIADGVATVDLSSEFAAGVDPLEDRGRLAQIVFTLTQFPTVDGVKFRIAGVPLVFRSADGTVQNRAQTRRAYEDVTPAIFVERPAVGDTVSSPLAVSGTANTFEATFMIRVRDSAGASVFNKHFMATSGSGTRGTFDETISFTAAAPAITLEVYESSAASGLPIHVVKIPLAYAE